MGNGALPKTQRETQNTVSGFYHAQMILFRMGRANRPGLIDGGLNITDTLETRDTTSKTVKSYLVVVNIDEYSLCTTIEKCKRGRKDETVATILPLEIK